MTDREMLELAAKANGHGVYFDELSGFTFTDSKFTGVVWDPLHNDGDALRLAVKLEIQAGYSEFTGCARASWFRGSREESVYGPDDPYAASRRAIVRAAAEIGRAMK